MKACVIYTTVVIYSLKVDQKQFSAAIKKLIKIPSVGIHFTSTISSFLSNRKDENIKLESIEVTMHVPVELFARFYFSL